MQGRDRDAEPTSAGRRAVLMIFGGVVFVLVVAGYFAARLRAATQEQLAPRATPSASAAP